MTDINQINDSVHSLNPAARPDSKKSSSDSFEKLLNQAVDNPEGSQMQTSATVGLQEISSPNPVIFTPTETISRGTDSLLSLLETYTLKLADPGASLKEIAPVLEQMNRDAEKLLDDSTGLGESDDELKQIATQAAVTAQTEYLKFQRGDYLS